MTATTPLKAIDRGSISPATNQRVAARRARTAFDTRIEQLEHENAALMRTLVNVEKAVKWLPDSQRVRARARLRRLGLEGQPDAFEGLHDIIDGSAAA
jgi:hypothetical protein